MATEKFLSPTPRDLVRIAGNRVFIDGLRDTATERALEPQLGRIGTTGFVCAALADRSTTTLRRKTRGRFVTEDG